MGGNGNCNFRETLARPNGSRTGLQPWCRNVRREETLLTSNRMRFMGSSLEILAEPLDKDKAVSLQCQLHHMDVAADRGF